MATIEEVIHAVFPGIDKDLIMGYEFAEGNQYGNPPPRVIITYNEQRTLDLPYTTVGDLPFAMCTANGDFPE